jgi:ADP-ribose pyrophosphatase YjhB (NUDIX family)
LLCATPHIRKLTSFRISAGDGGDGAPYGFGIVVDEIGWDFMSVIECITLDGHKKMIQRDSLVLRPAVYAIIVHDDRVLLMKMRHSGKYHPPGGGVSAGERMADALKREIREETGIEVEIERLAHFEELFFYYDPSEIAYHGLHFYYVCHPKTLTLLDDTQVNDDAAGKPRWVSIQSLQAQHFQAHGDIILELCKETA